MYRKLIATVAVLVLALAFSSVMLGGFVEAQPPYPTPDADGHGIAHHLAAGADVRSLTLAPTVTDTAIAGLVDRVDAARWHADVETLAGFGAAEPGGWGTRRTLTLGNQAARDWIEAALAGRGWDTSLHTFFMIGGSSQNVVAERVGSMRPDDVYIVSAHFDSTSDQAYTLAPGAEDNASGTAALLEIARVLQDQTPASTIRLIAFSGEEQGLIGSRAYVSRLEDVTGELNNVKGVYNLDMVGYTSNPSSRHVVLESYDPDLYPWMGDFRDHLASMTATYTDLAVYRANGGCCSDHAPFLWEQVPAVLLISAEFRSYPHYHSVNDLPEYVVPAQGAEVIKAVVAALAEKAGIVCVVADINCDGATDLADLLELSAHWGLSLGDTGYDERHDLNGDDVVNIVDLQIGARAMSGP